MKRIDLFCASPSSTAVDRHATVRLGQKLIERQYYSTCSSSELLPFTPRPYNNRKSTNNDFCPRRKSSANVDELKKSSLSSGDSSRYLLINTDRWISAESDRTVAATLKKTTPTTNKVHVSSSITTNDDRYSLSVSARLKNNYESPVFSSNDINHSPASTRSAGNYAPAFISSSGNQSPAVFNSSSHESTTQNQVVVLRVSIHCKGCEGKLRKHISKMKGVTSFEIDLRTKKVTVIGDVTPLSVLESVSRVKTAQLWPSSSPPAISSTITT